MLFSQAGNLNQKEDSFDELMADLFVLVTHHSLTQCKSALSQIVERLEYLCRHSEIEHYPKQLTVLVKMRRLWSIKLFDVEHSMFKH